MSNKQFWLDLAKQAKEYQIKLDLENKFNVRAYYIGFSRYYANAVAKGNRAVNKPPYHLRFMTVAPQIVRNRAKQHYGCGFDPAFDEEKGRYMKLHKFLENK